MEYQKTKFDKIFEVVMASGLILVGLILVFKVSITLIPIFF